MATISTDRLEVAKTISGNSPFTMSFPEAASQTFKKGDILSLDANGRATIATTPIIASSKVLGVAAEDGHNAAASVTNNVVIWVACDDTIFRGNSNSVTAITFAGKSYRIIITSAKCVVDTTSGEQVAIANRSAIVLRLDPRDAIGDTNGRVEFMFHPACCALTYTS